MGDEVLPKSRGMKPQQKRLLIEIAVVTAIALIVILFVPPMLVDLGQASRVNQLGRFLALAIVALGIDLIWGYTGLLSLGHGILFALGGYAIGMYLKLQIPPNASIQLPEFMSLYDVKELPGFWKPFYSFPFTLAAVVLLPTLLGGLLGYLVFRNRIKGVYFSILTQAATIVFFNFFNGQQGFFNGTNGLTDFKTINLGRWGTCIQSFYPSIKSWNINSWRLVVAPVCWISKEDINSEQTQFIFYTLTVLFLVAAYALCRWLTSGRFGRLLVAIRDDEPRVRFSGYNPTTFKVVVFAISAGLAGIAGALYTVQTGLISPKAMDIAFSIEMVIWVAVGGRASLSGAVLGAVLVNFAKSFLSEQFAATWLFFQGGLFLLVVLVLPDGLVGWLRSQPIQQIKTFIGIRPQVATYPRIEEDPEIQRERENLES
ncbi:MAG: urea ABC transporter permease subunit UrtC [Cyanosarcina radialis HA8281-LM2]|jgi:urea transport system permease protein|nr:urea ABC transporter permease subunit UrtC [Cyanosarcina radialis HA8281-LM2]